jgi:hypothetical protein
VAEMPMKICYPALEDQEWKFITGSDPKNTWVLNYPLLLWVLQIVLHFFPTFVLLCCRPWSYHNGGSWPTLLWQVSKKLWFLFT